METAKPHQCPPELLDNIPVPWIIVHRERIEEAIWLNAELIEAVLSNNRGVIHFCIVCYSKLAHL